MSAGSLEEMSRAQRAPDPPALAEAAQPHASGDHQRALELLSAAAVKGDSEAIHRLGLRLLTGFNAPYNPVQGAQLVQKAAKIGNPAAAVRFATLSAMGMYVPQSWQHSLGALVFAAEHGSADAQAQLRVLAEDRELAAAAETGEQAADVWGRLAHSIDLNRWHRPAAGANLHDSPLVRHFPAFIPERFCDWMIEHSRGRLERAKVYDAVAKEQTVSETRSNTAAHFDLLHSDLVSVLIQVHICASTGVPFRQLEPTTVLHYAEGEQITEHFDFVDPLAPDYDKEIAQKGQRIVTFLVYLNDDYADGETELPEIGVSHKGTRGEGLFFVNIDEEGNADTRTLHAGRPPASGEKWIISQFIRNRPTF